MEEHMSRITISLERVSLVQPETYIIMSVVQQEVMISPSLLYTMTCFDLDGLLYHLILCITLMYLPQWQTIHITKYMTNL